MSHTRIVVRIFALLTLVSVPLAARDGGIIPSPAGSDTKLHVEAGITYSSGVSNVVDQIQENHGFDRSSEWPVGLRLSVYAKQSNGFAFGAGIGPWTVIRIEDRDYRRRHHRYDDDDEWNYIVPVCADVRYFFTTSGAFEPFVRAGIVYPITSGDYIGSSTPGPLVAVGAQVWDSRYVAIGFEVGYDGSQVEVKGGPLHRTEKVDSGELNLSVLARF
jgi:hypothetical protein